MSFDKDDLIDRAAAAASAGSSRGGLSFSGCSAREATKYIAKCLLELSSASGEQIGENLLKEVDSLIQAIGVLQHRRQFCEATFRHTVMAHTSNTSSSLGKYGLNQAEEEQKDNLHPALIWPLSEAGLLSFHFDYLLALDRESLHRLAGQLLTCDENSKAMGGKHAQIIGKILRFVVEAATTTTSTTDACERSLQILGDLRKLWSSSAGTFALACAIHATKCVFPAAFFSSFWMSEVKCHLLEQEEEENSKEQRGRRIPEALEKMCEQILPGVLVGDFCTALKDVMVSEGAQSKLECVAHCIRVFSDMQVENSKELQLLFFELGSEAFGSSDAVLLSNILLSNQKSIEVSADSSSDSGLFRRWLRDYMQSQIDRCKASASGYNPARVTQFILKVFNEFVPTESPAMLLAHKEVMKTLSGLNDLYVRDYCNLVQARLNDFDQVDIPSITEEGVKEVARQEIAFCNNDFQVPDSVVLKARMWTPTWWKKTILPALKVPPDTKRGQVLRGQYMEALVRKELLQASIFTEYKEACAKMMGSIEESLPSRKSLSLSHVKSIACDRVKEVLMSGKARDLNALLPEVKLTLTAYASQSKSRDERDEFFGLFVDNFWTAYSSSYSRRYNKWGNAAQQTAWVCEFLRLVEEIEALKMNFLAKILSLISGVCAAADLSAEHIAALASLLVNMSLVSLIPSNGGGEPLFSWNFDGKDQLNSTFGVSCHWTNHLFGKLNLHTPQLREFACHLSISYIAQSLQFSNFILAPKDIIDEKGSVLYSTGCSRSVVIPILALELLSWVHARFAVSSNQSSFRNVVERFFESGMMRCIGAIYKVNVGDLQLLRPPPDVS